MKLHWGIFYITLLLISCRSDKHDETIQIQPTLASCLEEALSWFIEHENYTDTSYFYSISFHEYNEKLCVWDDTLILIGKPNKLFPKEGFKGYTTVGDFKLLVFDKQDLGKSFFNQDSLKSINLDSILFTTDTAYFLDVIVKDTVLLPRGCGVDGLDFFRI